MTLEANKNPTKLELSGVKIKLPPDEPHPTAKITTASINPKNFLTKTSKFFQVSGLREAGKNACPKIKLLNWTLAMSGSSSGVTGNPTLINMTYNEIKMRKASTIIKEMADQAVGGVERLLQVSSSGKKKFATLLLCDMLAEKGISLSKKQTKAAIDAAFLRHRYQRFGGATCSLILLLVSLVNGEELLRLYS